jgi:hypothetical protein
MTRGPRESMLKVIRLDLFKPIVVEGGDILGNPILCTIT